MNLSEAIFVSLIIISWGCSVGKILYPHLLKAFSCNAKEKVKFFEQIEYTTLELILEVLFARPSYSNANLLNLQLSVGSSSQKEKLPSVFSHSFLCKSHFNPSGN